MTGFLQFGANAFDAYKSVAPILQKGLERSKSNNIIDLASGGGGGFIRLAKRLKVAIPNLTVVMTDLYPNVEAFERDPSKDPEMFKFSSTPVDAMNVQEDLSGFRTMFLSFHHFKPEEAKRILQNAVDSKAPIAIFEVQQRNVSSFVPMILSPVSVLLATPFIRPFRFGRILFTYLIPILPLTVLWDGIVSVLRTYTASEMREMTSALDNGHLFQWDIGLSKKSPGAVLYLMGIPKTLFEPMA